ncbi:hypothetical protein D3C71_1751410 [compost metagenome]
MAGLQDHLCLRQVACRCAQLANQFQQALDSGEHIQIFLLGVDVFLRDAQVLEFADGVIGR